jgi:hypothetical protein
MSSSCHAATSSSHHAKQEGPIRVGLGLDNVHDHHYLWELLCCRG